MKTTRMQPALLFLLILLVMVSGGVGDGGTLFGYQLRQVDAFETFYIKRSPSTMTGPKFRHRPVMFPTNTAVQTSKTTTTIVSLCPPSRIRRCRTSLPSTPSTAPPTIGLSRRTSTTRMSLSPSFGSGGSSLVAPGDMWGNLSVLMGTATVSQTIGQRTALGRLLGAPVTAMALTFGAASIGILSGGGTATSKSLQSLTLQFATPLILLGADLRDCTKRCGPLLLSFACASVATVLACCVGWKYVAGPQLINALGRDGLVIAAALMAKNIGGGINYIAVCRSLNASPQAIAAGLCIDNIFALIYFPATTAIGSNRPDVVANVDVDEDQETSIRNCTTNIISGDAGDKTTSTSMQSDSIDNDDDDNASVSVQSVSSSLCLSAALLWLGERIGGQSGALPMTTLLTVITASQLSRFGWFRSIQPACNVVGTTCLYLFFSTAGAIGLSVADSVRSSLVPLTLFLTSLYSIHGLVLWLGFRLWGKKHGAFIPQRLLVASSSAIGGPATSVALAKSLNWKSLEVPSLLGTEYLHTFLFSFTELLLFFDLLLSLPHLTYIFVLLLFPTHHHHHPDSIEVGNIGYAIATFCGIGFFKLFVS